MSADRVEVTVTDRPGPETPVKVRSLPWWRVIAVRAGRTWLQGLIAFLGAGFLSPSAPGDATGLVLAPYAGQLAVAAQLALLPAIVSAAMNALELLNKVDAQAPEWRA